MEEVEKNLTAEKTEAAKTQDEIEPSADGEGKPKPLVPTDPAKPPVDSQLSDQLSDLSVVVNKTDDVETKEIFEAGGPLGPPVLQAERYPDERDKDH